VSISSLLVDALLQPVFGLVLATWAGASLFLLLNGLRNGRRALALERGRRALARIDVPETDEEGLRTAVISVFAALTRDVVLPLSIRGTGRPVLDRVIADAATARIGRDTLEMLATTTAAPKHNWRRIAAMKLLATGGHPDLVALLRKTLDDKGLVVEEGTLYPLLRRLESQGLLTSEWREEDKRSKRFYLLSGDGARMLDLLLAEWQAIGRSLTGILSESDHGSARPVSSVR